MLEVAHSGEDHREPLLIGGDDDLMQQSQYGRLQGVVISLAQLVIAVGGQQVLRQIVQADGDRIHVMEDLVDHHGSGGDFDHRR